MMHETTIKGVLGERLYYAEPHPVVEAVPLQLKVMQILGGPAGQALGAMFGGLSDLKAEDARALGSGLSDLAAAIMAQGGERLVVEILTYTRVRATIQGAGGAVEQITNLRDAGALDLLYRGNIWEMWRAVAWVLFTVEFSPFGPGESDGWRQLWSKLAASAPQPTTPTSATKAEPPSSGSLLARP